jgi:hypothetical protein
MLEYVALQVSLVDGVLLVLHRRGAALAQLVVSLTSNGILVDDVLILAAEADESLIHMDARVGDVTIIHAGARPEAVPLDEDAEQHVLLPCRWPLLRLLKSLAIAFRRRRRRRLFLRGGAGGAARLPGRRRRRSTALPGRTSHD